MGRPLQSVMSERAVVLLSGGLDSTIVLHLAHRAEREVHTLSFSYGQLHTRELECAKWQSEAVGAASHRVVDLSFASWGGSSLTDPALPMDAGQIFRSKTPNTYVPARNMVFLSVAASIAEAVGALEIHIGVSEVDYSGYVDCREVFIRSMERTINLGTERRFADGREMRIIAPFLHVSKAEEVSLGLELGVDFSHTWTCYQGAARPCGRCDGCLLRAKAFSEAGVQDPLTL